jgi:hypothetical protein
MQIENILPQNIFKEINDCMGGYNFPWYWDPGTSYTADENIFQFTHVFYLDGKINSDFMSIPQLILKYFEERSGIKVKSVQRVKANLLPRQSYTEEDKKIAIHRDLLNDDFLSFVYYVIDTDGYTSIYDNDKKRIIKEYEPKANSVVYFKSNCWHGTVPPTLNKRRIIINFVVQI